MTSPLDFGPIFTPTGSITQLEYATKASESGSTIIFLKSNHGIVIAIEKPKESKLIPTHLNKILRKLPGTSFICASGILSDSFYIFDRISQNISDHLSNTEENSLSRNFLKMNVSSIVHMFTRYMGIRPVGINLISGMFHNNEYQVLVTDVTSKSTFFKGYAIGKGSTRAKTELEKVVDDNLSVEEMEDHLVRIMYKTYDPLKDKEFDIEMWFMNEKTEFKMKEVEYERVYDLVEKYKDLTVDGE